MRISRHVPVIIKRTARMIYYFLVDSYRAITGTRKPMTPPAMSALLVGSGNFNAIGQGISEDLKKKVGLNASSRVLEIGCGYGRIAVPLTTLIKSPGYYDGTDVVKAATDWCTHEINSVHPNFRFHHSDISNPYANSGKGENASSYVLPFDSETYDIVFLTSVFSHMRPVEIENYLSEISRVLRPGGACYATYYLLNEFSSDQIRSKKSAQPFKYQFEDFLSTHKNIPEQTIAIDEGMIRNYYEAAGLRIDEPVNYGTWANRKNDLHYQDLIVAWKE